MGRNLSLSFRSRMWVILGVAFSASLFLQLPSTIHKVIMDRRVQSLEADAERSLGPSPSVDDAVQYLQQKGFNVWAPGSSNVAGERGIGVMAERGLSGGSVLWRPATARVWLHFDLNGQLKVNDWDLWSFASQGLPSSDFDDVLADKSGFLMLFGVAVVIAANIRRSARRSRGQCLECGYDLRGQPPHPEGQSSKCPECGRSV